MKRLAVLVVCFGLIFSAGCSNPVSYTVILRNQDSLPTHLLFTDEVSSSYNKVEPGQSRSEEFSCARYEHQDSWMFEVDVRAMRNGSLLGSTRHSEECSDSMPTTWVFTWTGTGWSFNAK